jgi:hypothetical protein
MAEMSFLYIELLDFMPQAIAIASDHAGVELKAALVRLLESHGHSSTD